MCVWQRGFTPHRLAIPREGPGRKHPTCELRISPQDAEVTAGHAEQSVLVN